MEVLATFDIGPKEGFQPSKRDKSERGVQMTRVILLKSGFLYCNLPVFPRAHRKDCTLTTDFHFGFSLQLEKFPSFKIEWANSINLRWFGDCSRGFSIPGVKATLYVHWKFLSSLASPGIERSLSCLSVFTRRIAAWILSDRFIFSVSLVGSSNSSTLILPLNQDNGTYCLIFRTRSNVYTIYLTVAYIARV